ncbi:MAG TPA: hypothetical protein VLK84_29270 [Longimicrobium sp.]|nr:hypothetical protein [Longimicrobium sp.]
MRALATTLLGIALAGCGTASADRAPEASAGQTAAAPRAAAESPAAVPASQPQTAFACLSADSVGGGRDTLVFSDVTLSAETGDASGTEISLWQEGTAWRGATREAEGELGSPRPLESLALDPRDGRIALAYGNGSGDVFRFQGAFSCERLSGAWELYEGVRKEDSVLPRVPHSGYTPPAEPLDDGDEGE